MGTAGSYELYYHVKQFDSDNEGSFFIVQRVQGSADDGNPAGIPVDFPEFVRGVGEGDGQEEILEIPRKVMRAAFLSIWA